MDWFAGVVIKAMNSFHCNRTRLPHSYFRIFQILNIINIKDDTTNAVLYESILHAVIQEKYN